VDPVNKTIASYRADQLDTPMYFSIGETADAEPALPGWRVMVSAIFRA